jgi:hypothetical protein
VETSAPNTAAKEQENGGGKLSGTACATADAKYMEEHISGFSPSNEYLRYNNLALGAAIVIRI